MPGIAQIITWLIVGGLAGSLIGGIRETQEMLEFCADKGITAEQVGDDFLASAPQEDVDLFIDVTMKCVDFRSLLVAEFSQGVSQESAECLADGIPDEFIRVAAEAGIRDEEFALEDDPDLAGEIISLVAACLSPEELQNLGNS